MTAAREVGRSERRRTITVGACLLTVLGLLPGCSFWAPNVVAYNYAPADGLNQDLPDVKIRNLLVVGGAIDGPAALSATLVNLTAAAVPVKFAVGDGALDTTVEVPGNGTLTLTGASDGTPGSASAPVTVAAGGDPNGGSNAAGSDASQVVSIESLGTAAGGTVPVVISTPQGGAVTLLTPVLLDTGPYEGFLPS